MNLFLLNESITNGFNNAFLDIISYIAILSGIFVIISKNPIISVLFLIGLFLSVSGYLMILGINFIALSYILVYVGAVSILFLFILMMINIRISELVTDTSNSIPLAILISILFNIAIIDKIPSNHFSLLNYSYYSSNIEKLLSGGLTMHPHELLSYSIKNKTNTFETNNNILSGSDITLPVNKDINFVSSQIWDGNLSETSHITTLGNIIYTNYPIWLIITSIILLLAMVGAIVITIKQKDN